MGSGRVAVGDAPCLRSLLPDCPALRHSAIRLGARVDPCRGTSGVSRGVPEGRWGDSARIREFESKLFLATLWGCLSY